jgi:hypothetical protein
MRAIPTQASTPVKHRYRCPVCGKDNGEITSRDERWWVHCFSCPSGGEYLKALAREIGSNEILTNPPTALRPYLIGRVARNSRQPAKPPERLPTRTHLRRCGERLQANPGALEYLTKGRGLSRPTIRRWRLGYDGTNYLFPVIERGRVVNVVRHRPGANPKYRGARGHPACLYPRLPSGRSVVLVAGVFDALIGCQHNLPCVTSTAGASVGAHLFELFRGKRVAVVFDAGESVQAQRAVSMLQAAGVESWAVDLPLDHGEDVADWFHVHGRSRDELLDLIRRAR